MTTSTLKTSKRIHSVTLRRMVDESPDTSWLGEYSNHPTSEYSIDRAHSLDCAANSGCKDCQEQAEEICTCGGRGHNTREYRYFNPSPNYLNKPDTGYTSEEVRQCVRQDYKRMEALNRGDWCFVGIRADAEVDLPGGRLARRGRLARISQTITSGGLWGIESDSDDSHFAEIEAEELASLRSQLEAIGFSKRAVSAAFRNIERREI